MTTFKRLLVCEGGELRVWFNKTPMPGYENVKDNWGVHRCSAIPDADLSKLFANMNVDLAVMGVNAIPQSEWDKIIAHSQLAWTPEVVEAFEAVQEAARAAE